jgi:fibronectin-binding autotransporter adhesin
MKARLNRVLLAPVFVVAALAAAGLSAQPATAAVWTWSASTTGPSPSDGDGTWNTTSANWWSASSSTSGSTWVNGSTNSALFGVGSPGSTAYLVDLSGGSISTGGLTFQNQAYTISNGTLNLAAATVAVNSAAGGTIGATVTAASGLTKAGSGTLALTGPLSYTGTSAVSAGTLTFNGSSGTIGEIHVGTTSGSGTAGMYFHSGNLSAGALITGYASGGTASYYQDGGSANFTGLTLSNVAGTPTTFTLTGGTFGDTGSASAIGQVGPLTYNQSGGLFAFSSTTASGFLQTAFQTTAPTTMTISGGTFQVASNNIFYLADRAGTTMNISGNALVKTGTFSFNRAAATLGAAAAVVNLNGGILQPKTILEGYNNTVGTGGTLNLNGGTLQAAVGSLSAWIPANAHLVLNVNGGGALIDTNGQNVAISQPLLDGSGGTADSLTKFSSGLLTLAGASTYQGTTTVSGGTLQIGNGGSLYSLGLIAVNANAVLAFSRNDSPYQGLDFSSSDISGAGGLAQIGTGLLTLTASNSYSGPTNIGAGTLAVNGAITQSSTISVGTAATLAGSGLIGGNTSLTTLSGNGVINLSGGTIGGPLNVTGGNWNGTGTVAGLVASSSNVFTVASGASLNASGNMLLNGGTLTGQGGISGGTLTLGSGAAIAPGATANVNSVGTLTLPSLATNGGGILSYDFSNTTTVGGGVNDLIQVAGNLSLAGTITLALNPSGGTYASGSPYTLFTYAGHLNQSGAAFTFAPGSIGGRQNASFDYGSGSNSAITVTITGYFANLTWVGSGSQTWVDNPNVKPWTSPTSPTGDYFAKGDSVTFVDTVGGSTISISGAVAPISLTVSNTNTSYTFGGSGSIGGAASLVMNGPGALTINTSNTYSGGTYLNGGALNLGNSAALGGGALTINGGTLDNTSGVPMTLANNLAQSWSGDFTFNGTQSLNLGTGAVTLGGGRTVTVNANTLTVGGAISDGGNYYSLALAGSGALVLAASNGYSGGTTINGGTLQVNDINALGSGPVYDNAALRYNLSGGSIAGGINGAGDVIYSGGSLTLNGAQYNSGATIVSAGTLALGSSASLASATVSVAGGAVFTAPAAVTLNTATALNVNGSAYFNSPSQTIASLDGGNNGVVFLNGTALTVSTSGNFAGSLRDNGGHGSLTVSGGNLTLGGSNSYSGPTTITAGTLALGAAGKLGGGTLTINPGGTLDVSAYGPSGYSFGGSVLNAGNTYPTSGDINGTLNLQNAALNVAGGNAGTVTITNGGLGLSGGTLNYAPGDLITMPGALALSNTLNIALLSPMTSGTYTLFSYGSISGGTGNLALVGPYVVNSPRVSYAFSASGGSVDLTMTGAAGNLQWNGGSNQTWDSAVSPSWTNLSSGSADVFYLNDNVTFNDTPGTAQTVTISGAVQPGSLIFSNTAASYTLAGSGSIVGVTSMTINGPGAVTIGTSNAYTGGTNLLGGRLNIANSAALGSGTLTISSGTLDNTGGAALTLAGSFAKNISGGFVFGGSSPLNTGSGAVALGAPATITVSGTGGLTIGGALSGAGALTKNGPGTLILTTNSSFFNGGIALSSGLLVLNSTAALGTGPLTINGGSLDCTSSSSVTLNSNPQNWNGDFTFVGSQNLSSGLGAAITLGSSRTVTVNSSRLTAGPIGDGGNGYSLTLNGSGNMALGSASNTFSGGIVVNGGTLSLTATGPTQGASVLAQSSAITINPGGMFYTALQAEIGYSNHMTFLINGGTLGMADAAFQYIFNPIISNGGVWALGGGNGTYQNGATFGLTSVTSLASSATNVISSRGGYVAATANPTFNVQRGTAPIDLLVSARLFDYNSTGDSISKTGNGILALTGSNTYTGATTINGGTLQLGNGGTTGSISASSAVLDNGALVFNRSDTGAGYTFASAVSGSGSLAQIGSGIVLLAGTNTYTGGTIVSGGTLIVTNSLGIEDGTSLFVGDPGLLPLLAPVIPSSAVPSIAGAASAVAPVPEPGTLALLAGGAAAMVLAVQKKRRASRAHCTGTTAATANRNVR